VLFLVLVLVASGPQTREAASCPASPVITETAPSDPSADPIVQSEWYINGDRTLWAGPMPKGGWSSGGQLYSGNRVIKGQKTYWVRPVGADLAISGRRLDASAPPVEAFIPCCYKSGFQIVGLYFPTEGCWEVSARAGASELRFVTLVRSGSGAGEAK
jgi:hypothetical protein